MNNSKQLTMHCKFHIEVHTPKLCTPKHTQTTHLCCTLFTFHNVRVFAQLTAQLMVATAMLVVMIVQRSIQIRFHSARYWCWRWQRRRRLSSSSTCFDDDDRRWRCDGCRWGWRTDSGGGGRECGRWHSDGVGGSDDGWIDVDADCGRRWCGVGRRCRRGFLLVFWPEAEQFTQNGAARG